MLDAAKDGDRAWSRRGRGWSLDTSEIPYSRSQCSSLRDTKYGSLAGGRQPNIRNYNGTYVPNYHGKACSYGYALTHNSLLDSIYNSNSSSNSYSSTMPVYTTQNQGKGLPYPAKAYPQLPAYNTYYAPRGMVGGAYMPGVGCPPYPCYSQPRSALVAPQQYPVYYYYKSNQKYCATAAAPATTVASYYGQKAPAAAAWAAGKTTMAAPYYAQPVLGYPTVPAVYYRPSVNGVTILSNTGGMATSVMPAAGKKKRRRKRKRKRKSKKNKTGEESEGQLEITELDNNSDGMSPSSDDGSEEGLVTDPKTDGVVIVENVRADCYKPIEVIVHETDDSLWWDEDIDVIDRKTITNVAEYEEISGIDNMVSVDLWDEEAEEQRCPSIEEEFNAIEMTDYGKKHNPRLPRPDSGFQDDDVVLSSIETEMEVLAATRRADRADSGVQSDGDSECEINTDEQQQQHMSKYPAIFDDDDDDEEVFNVKTQTSIVEKILSKTKGEKSRLIVGKEDEIMPGCCVPGCTIL